MTQQATFTNSSTHSQQYLVKSLLQILEGNYALAMSRTALWIVKNVNPKYGIK